MRYRSALVVCAVVIGLVAAAIPAAAQETGEPITWVISVSVKPGKFSELEKATEKYDKPVFDKLVANGTITSWGFGRQVLGPPSESGMYWVTANDWAAMGKVDMAFEDNYKAMKPEDAKAAMGAFLGATVPEKESSWAVRHVVFKGTPGGKLNYLARHVYEFKPGKGQAAMKMFKEYNAPVYDRLLAAGVISGYGVAVRVDAAQKLRLLGFQVSGWSRTVKHVEGLSSWAGPEALEEFLAQADILVCLLPLTSETQGILNRRTFARLPAGAYIINAARGEHLVEADLLAALDSGHLSGACLDVFREEPLAESHPFWNHPASPSPRTAPASPIPRPWRPSLWKTTAGSNRGLRPCMSSTSKKVLKRSASMKSAVKTIMVAALLRTLALHSATTPGVLNPANAWMHLLLINEVCRMALAGKRYSR